jgi:signal transduction histidine kinase
MSSELRVLAVDDEVGMREGIQRVLTKRGYAVDTAANGEEAIAQLQARDYQIVLVDLKMPGIDGFQVTQYLQEHCPRSVPVVVSAFATVEAAVDVTRRGAFDFLVKPFTPTDLLQVVERSARQYELIREREQYLTELSSERNLSRQIINSMRDGVMVLNINRKPALMNPRAEMLLDRRYTGDLELRDLPFSEGIHEAIDRILADGAEHYEARSFQEELGGRMLQLRVAPYLRGEEMAGVLVIISDITEQWKAEQDKDRFVSMVAHELASPIGAMLSYINLILTGLLDENIQEIHRIMERSKIRGEALLTLVQDLQYFNRRDGGRTEKSAEWLDLRAVIQEQAQFLNVQAEAKSVRIQVCAEAGDYPVLADRGDLDRIFMNLISNGIKYNREHGTLTIQLRRAAPDGAIDVEVSDTGIGMSEEEMQHLFEEFYRVKNPDTSGIPGTGLGLATVKRVLEEYNGRIQVSSDPGKGTTFTVHLPPPATLSRG